ncbi:MAG: hypothetical protein KME17_18935 [Cyanosarcina radialis HA8281-LM2]|jgi:hypothetical protein|nr:hypothetical protein [Cyanosarcina radialis HA8281-LM2]
MLVKEKTLKLQSGVQLFCCPNLEPKSPRILLSSGTTQEIELVDDRLKYRSGAFVPQEPWREPNFTESNLLRMARINSSDRPWGLGSDLGVCRFPDRVLAPIEAIIEPLERQFDPTRESYKQLSRSIRSHRDYQQAIAAITDYLPHYYLYPHQPTNIGVYVGQPGLRTVTTDLDSSIDSTTRYHIGMHLDSHDLFPLRRRHRSRNRICLNLGREDRFFLFINLPLMEIFKALNLSDPEDIFQHYRGLNLGYEFMKLYPSYPVIKLKVAPGEAYIAPTDNLIHDGCSVGQQSADINLTFLGYFGI